MVFCFVGYNYLCILECVGCMYKLQPMEDLVPFCCLIILVLLDEAAGSSEDDFSGGEMEALEDYQINEDRELKEKLLRKYSGYISTLKHEFSKKKKKGKLPKEARQILLDWWNVHYKWPYPTVNYVECVYISKNFTLFCLRRKRKYHIILLQLTFVNI